MGYFNYFIKCVIRNITYKLCKPKVFITVLFCVIILLFCFKNYGYCTEQIDPVITNPTEELPDSYHVYDNQFLTVREIQESRQRKVITRLYALYDIKPDETRQFVSKILFELQDGSSEGPRCLYVSEGSGSFEFMIAVYFPKKMIYSGIDGYTNNRTTYPSIPLYNGPVYYRTINSDSSFTMNSTYGEWQLPSAFMNVFIPEWVQMFKDFGLINTYTDSTIIEKLDELIAKSSSTTNQQILEEMKEQNQLQQEQNDFVQQEATDNDVSVDGFNSVDSNDITSSGLTGIFNSIYSSISSWNSKDIILPVPFTNKSITIHANYTNNMLNSVGGQTLINIVSTIYYFLVARFIIYSITGIINSIKSGSILETDTKNNITTEML